MSSTEDVPADTGDTPPGVDPAKPSPSRLYDYFLGGKDNFAADREAAEKMKAAAPDMVDSMWANRGFHGRAAVWMANHGIRQFIDVGWGLPAQNNTHQAVRKVIPDARVVYVDSDPMVTAHAETLLAGDKATGVVNVDPRDPEQVLSHPVMRRLIDFGEPAGVLMTTMLHFVADGSDPWGLVQRYMTAVAPGSYLALSQGTYEGFDPRRIQAGVEGYAASTEHIYLRSRAETERYFEGLELVEPYDGAKPEVTYAGLWGAEDTEAADSNGSRGLYVGVALRPEQYPRCEGSSGA
jgi:hypothetical protein